MSEVGRKRNEPGVPSPGIDYQSAVGMTAEERADVSIADVAAEKAARVAEHQHASTATEVAASIATALGELIGVANGGGRKGISPAVLQARREAWADMEIVLAHYRDVGEKPVYELTAPLFCDDVLIPAIRQDGREQVATRINFLDIPNEQMIPRNDAASRVMDLFLKAIGGKTPDLGDTSYEAYLHRPRVAQVIGAPLETPTLGSPGQLHESRATVLEHTPDEEKRYVGPKKQLGTLQPEIHGAI